MRFALALIVLVLCVEAADAGPLLDRCRERREARLNGGPVFPRLVARPTAGGCESGQCSPSVRQSGTVYYSIQPAGGGCANGQCPIPVR